MLSHKVYKKGKNPDELFPYLQTGVPDFLEDDRVHKARKILGSATGPNAEQMQSEIRDKIREEIELEAEKEYPDRYVINQLEKML